MFRLGQQVQVIRDHHIVAPGLVGTVIGYCWYFDDDEEEWKEDETEPLIQFDPDLIPEGHLAWDIRDDSYHDHGQLYLDDYHLSAYSEEMTFEHRKKTVENRHNDYKERMLLRHRSG